MALQFKGSSSLVLPDVLMSGDFTINLPIIHYTRAPSGDPQVIISTIASSSVTVGIYDSGSIYLNAGGTTASLPTGFQEGDVIDGAVVQRVGDTITISYTNSEETLTNSVTASLDFTFLRIGNDKNNDRPLYSTLAGVFEIIRSNAGNITWDFDAEVTPNVLTDTTSGLDGSYSDAVAEFVELGIVVKQVTFDLSSQMQGVSGLYYLVTSVPLGASILNGENLDTSAATLNMSLTSVDGIAIGMPLMLIATDKQEATDASDIIGWSVATVVGE
jgi:hypothetical protein